MPRRRPSRTRQPQPIPAGFWFTLLTIAMLPAWYLRLPAMSLLLAAIVIAGTTAQPPQTARRSDQPDPRKQAAYRKWKTMLSGLTPGKQWVAVWRTSWWTWLTLGALLSLNTLRWWTWTVNLLCAWIAGAGIQHYLDRRADRRHPCYGVSIPAFYRNAPTWQRIFISSLAGFALISLLLAAWFDYTSLSIAIVTPALMFLTLIRLFDGPRQLASWHTQVHWQTTLDQWIDDPDEQMRKPWRDAYVTKVDSVGDPDNPLTIIRCRVPAGFDTVYRAGTGPLQTHAFAMGLYYVQLIGASAKKQSASQFAPNMVRIVLAKDETAIPDMTSRSIGEKTASLAATLAYAKLGELFRKTPPIVTAHDVSDDDTRAAWLLTFTLAPNGVGISQIGRDWLANDPNPGDYMHLPVWRDLYDGFHLAADSATPLSDVGNKLKAANGAPLRPANRLTRSQRFNGYINACRRWKTLQTTWLEVTGDKIMPPEPLLDNEREYPMDGWTLTVLPFYYQSPNTAATYANHDLTPFDPSATFIGICEQSQDRFLMCTAHNNAPTRLDQLTGPRIYLNSYAQAIAYRALLRQTPKDGQITITACSQEGKTEAVWRIQIKLGNGVTAADLRRKTAHLQADMGATILYWEWVNAAEAVIWVMGRNLTSPQDTTAFKRATTQKQLIPLALSNAWGDAGVTDKSGKTPTVAKLAKLPNNNDVLLAKFTVPDGISIDRPQANIGKFLTASHYPYGRIIATYGSEFQMVLASASPFPTSVNADWQLARTCKPTLFPFGVDDMARPVYWEISHTPHLLVCGKTGSGKSSASMVLIAEAFLKGNGVIIIDPSKGANDFVQWAKPKALAFVGLYQLRETEAVIRWVREEMAERVRIYSHYGVANIKDLDPKQVTDEEREHLRPITVFFDEFNSYLQETGNLTQNPTKDIEITNANAEVSATNASVSRTMSNLSKIVVQGRSAGIRVIFGAQRLTMDDMKKYGGNAFFRSLGRLLLGADSPDGVVSQQNTREAHRMKDLLKTAEGDIPVGRGMYESIRNDLTCVQTWWAGTQDELAQLIETVPTPAPIDYQQYMPKAAEQFTKLATEDIHELLQTEPEPILEDEDAADSGAPIDTEEW